MRCIYEDGWGDVPVWRSISAYGNDVASGNFHGSDSYHLDTRPKYGYEELRLARGDANLPGDEYDAVDVGRYDHAE